MNLDANNETNNERNILYKLLSTLSNREWSEFEKFVESPYFNQGRNYGSIMKILRKHKPEFNSPELRKESLYKKLYPGKQYKESVMYSTFSRLYSIAEEFIVQIEMRNDNFIDRERLRLAALRTRGINTKAVSQISRMEKDLKNRKIYMEEFYHIKEFSKEIGFFYYQNNMRDKISGPVIEILKYSIYWHFVEFSIYLSSLYSQKNFHKSDYRKSIVSKLEGCLDKGKMLDIVKKHDPDNFKILYLHYLDIEASHTPYKDEPYHQMKELTFKSLDVMAKDYKNYFLNSLAKHCSMRFVAGDSKFKREAFEIRKKTVEEDLLSFNSDGNIRASEFRSTFIDALNMYEVDWAEKFATSYLPRLNPTIQEDIECYCKARIAYERRDYDKAIVYAGKVNINQILFKLDMKNLIAKIYYDTDSVEPLISALNSYYQIIHNADKTAEAITKRHAGFVKYLRKLCRVKFENKDKDDLKLLRRQIERENVTSGSWLIKKIDELQKGVK